MSETAQVYLAEFEVRDMLELTRVHLHGTTVEMPVERKFASLDSVQKYVDAVLALNWVRSRYLAAAQPLKVERAKTINVADCGHGIMRVNPDHTRWAMREIVILHEIAHHLSPADIHGFQFRTTFVHLVDEIIGSEVAWLLRTSFWDRHLQFASVQTRV